MTFRNTALLFFIFLLLNSCKGLQYYKSGTNPVGISVILKCPATFYTNLAAQDSVKFYLVNHNSQELVINHWWTDLFLIGQSRFYPKEVSMRPQPKDIPQKPLVIAPLDTAFLLTVPIKNLLSIEKNWTLKDQPVWGPHLINAKKYYPYMYLTAEFRTKIPNQEEVIKIRSEKIKVNIVPYNEQNLKSKKLILGISADVRNYNADTKNGNLFCKIENISEYPILLFNDPGSVRFKLYAYSPNRTTTMFTQYVLNNGKLPVSPINIDTKKIHTITIPLEQVLFTEAPVNPMYYWSWNKKTPPVSPLVYGKKDIATEVEFWFGVVVDGKEYLSNTIQFPIAMSKVKSTKK